MVGPARPPRHFYFVHFLRTEAAKVSHQLAFEGSNRGRYFVFNEHRFVDIEFVYFPFFQFSFGEFLIFFIPVIADQASFQISTGEFLFFSIQVIEDDPIDISWFWFYFCSTLYNCFWWTRCRNSTVGGPELIFYVAIETSMDDYVFVIELDKPIIGENPNEETVTQEMSDVQMVHDSNPFNELTNYDIVRSVRYRPRRVSV